MVGVEKGRIVLLEKLADEINRASKRSGKLKKKSKIVSLDRYKKLIGKKDTTVEKKKKELIGKLHKLLIDTVVNKELIEENIEIIKKVITKLRDINYYLRVIFLREIGLKKKKTKIIEKESDEINKNELNKLEYMVYKLINRIVFIDNKLIREYKKKEEKIIEDKKAEIKGLNAILKKQSELLCHLEAKMPPKRVVKKLLNKRKNHALWTASTVALLATLEHLYKKEISIFRQLKKNKNIYKRLSLKISHLVKEKKEALKLKEEKIMASERLRRLDERWEKALHEMTITARL